MTSKILLPESYARAKIKALHGVKSCALNEKSIDKKGIAFASIITFFRYFVAFSIEKQTCCPGGQTPDG